MEDDLNMKGPFWIVSQAQSKHEYYKSVARVLQECDKGVTRVFQGSIETNTYFTTNQISNIIHLMKIEQIKYWILFDYQEKNVMVLESKIFIYPKITF